MSSQVIINHFGFRNANFEFVAISLRNPNFAIRNSRREWLADPGCFRTESNTSLAGFGLSPAEVKHAVLLATFSKPLLLAINHDPPSRHFDPFGTKFSVKPGQANH